MLELGDFPGDGLDREAQVIGDIEAAERNGDLNWGRYAGPGALRQVEQEGNEAFTGGCASKANDLILGLIQLSADLLAKLGSEGRARIDEVVETTARKASESDGSDGLSRKQVGVAGGKAEKVAAVIEAKDGASAIFHCSVDPNTTFNQVKHVRGRFPFPAKRLGRRMSLGHLGREETPEGTL